MFRLFSSVPVCWICVPVLLCGSAFTSNISTQSPLPNVTVWDSPLLQLRARLPSYSQPLRPYTLVTKAEDFHYMPKPRHRRPSQLLRLLGSAFDPFWMSIDQPPEASKGDGEGQLLMNSDTPPASLLRFTVVRGKFNLSSSAELREAAEKHHQKLEKEVMKLDLSFLPSDVAGSVRAWLVHSATCELHYQWVDLGPAFWPRWLRQTDCQRSDRVQSCSFPSGMECVRSQTTSVKILAWHCLEIIDDESRRKKDERSDDSMEVGSSEPIKKCLWSQVPYPVVTACTCSCK